MMPQIDATLRARALQNPAATFAIIVRVTGDMDARQTQLESDGLTITRRMWLIQGFAGTASGATIGTLENYDWILSIEPDRQVHTMDSESK